MYHRFLVSQYFFPSLDYTPVRDFSSQRKASKEAPGGERDFPGGSDDEEPACNARRPRFDPWVGKSPGEGNATLSSVLALENPMDRGPDGLQPTGSQSRTRLSSKHTHGGGGGCMSNIDLLLPLVAQGKKMSVFSFKDSRKLSLLCRWEASAGCACGLGSGTQRPSSSSRSQEGLWVWVVLGAWPSGACSSVGSAPGGAAHTETPSLFSFLSR